MTTLRDAVGARGLFTDGDWILSENMSNQGTIGVIQLKHVGVGEFLNKDFQFITEKTFAELKCTEVFPGDVLISRMADPIARACIVPKLPFRAVTAVDVSILRPDPAVSSNRYLAYACNSPLIQNQALRATRGTTRARITRTELEELEIPLPQIREQDNIVGRLDAAAGLCSTRRYALKLCNEFLPAAFLEMFGDPQSDWPTVTIAEVAEDKNGAIRTGPFGSQLLHSEFTESGIAVLGIDNAVQNRFAWDQRRYISNEKYNQLRRYTVFPGDIIITIMGTCGRCAIVPGNIPVAINTKHLCCITLDRTKALPEFIHAAFLHHPAIRHQLGIATKGAIMDGLNMEIIKGLHFPLPPISLQNEFVEIVHRHEGLRTTHVEALRKADHLFQSLLHRAFNADF